MFVRGAMLYCLKPLPSLSLLLQCAIDYMCAFILWFLSSASPFRVHEHLGLLYLRLRTRCCVVLCRMSLLDLSKVLFWLAVKPVLGLLHGEIEVSRILRFLSQIQNNSSNHVFLVCHTISCRPC